MSRSSIGSPVSTTRRSARSMSCWPVTSPTRAAEMLVGGTWFIRASASLTRTKRRSRSRNAMPERRVAEDGVELGQVAVGRALQVLGAGVEGARPARPSPAAPVSGRRASKRPAPSSRAKRWSRLTGPTIARTAPKASSRDQHQQQRPARRRRSAIARGCAGACPRARSRSCSARLARGEAARARRGRRRSAGVGRGAASVRRASSRGSSASRARAVGARVALERRSAAGAAAAAQRRSRRADRRVRDVERDPLEHARPRDRVVGRARPDRRARSGCREPVEQHAERDQRDERDQRRRPRARGNGGPKVGARGSL